MNFLKAILLESTAEINNTTTSNIFLDEDGQFVDASQAVDNVASWWETLDIVNKITEKLPTVILAILLIVLGFILARVISKLSVKAMQSRGVDPSVYNFIKRTISVLIKFVFLMSALSMFVNINSLVAAIGAAGVTAGLGLQSSVAQFASGIQILINHPFKSGDFVEINGITGNVVDIRFMYTVITTADNKRIVVPNSDITANPIINYSSEENRRVDLSYSISYSDDIDKAKRVILETILADSRVLMEPAPAVNVDSHGANGINLVARIWCKGVDYWDVYYSLQEAVKYAFDKNSITIPCNQMDVHIINK